MPAEFCGLVCCGRPTPRVVPLKTIAVHADVRGWTVGVTAELLYENPLAEAIECQFVFPLSDKSAVYRLEAEIGGKKLSAELRPKKEAEELYKAAVESGDTAVLLENQSGSPDVFRVMLGNLAAKGEARVTIGFVQPIDRDHDGSLSFSLPSVLNPRFVPLDMLSDPEKMKDHFHFKVPYVAVSDVSYSMTFSAKINLGITAKIAEIKALNEEKDKIKVDFDAENLSASVSLDGSFVQDHDFGLRIVPSDPFKPMVFIEPGQAGDKKNWLSYDIACAWFEPQTASGKATGQGVPGDEFWFVVDRSGSMGGSKIEDAKNALLLFVKSLPVTCKFNIVGFGSSFSALFPQSVEYTEVNVEAALKHASEMSADMGGTEILRPLDFVYTQQKPTQPGARQFVVLLTDGEVGNTDQVIALAAKNAASSRVFSVGIGEGASSALVNGLARVSGGLSEFVRNANDRLQAKVISLLKAATNPGAENVSLAWEVSGGSLVSKMPDSLPTSAYHGHPIMQYALLHRNIGNILDGNSVLKASINDAEFHQKLPFSVASSIFSDAQDAMPLHRLAAKARILELESGDRSGLADISLATGVLCSETAFVAIDRETGKVAEDKSGRPRFINVERPSAYHTGRRLMLGGRGARMRMMRAAPAPAAMNSFGGVQAMSMMSNSAVSSYQPAIFSSFSVGDANSMHFGDSSARNVTAAKNEMEQLISLQRMNGSWLFSDQLAKLSGSGKVSNDSDLRSIVSAAAAGLTDENQATLTALAILHHRYAARRDEWELIEQKALNFLQSTNVGDIDKLVQTIASALGL